MWPDIPGAMIPRLKWVIDYHTGAFKRLREGGYEVRKDEQRIQQGRRIPYFRRMKGPQYGAWRPRGVEL